MLEIIDISCNNINMFICLAFWRIMCLKIACSELLFSDFTVVNQYCSASVCVCKCVSHYLLPWWLMKSCTKQCHVRFPPCSQLLYVTVHQVTSAIFYHELVGGSPASVTHAQGNGVGGALKYLYLTNKDTIILITIIIIIKYLFIKQYKSLTWLGLQISIFVHHFLTVLITLQPTRFCAQT